MHVRLALSERSRVEGRSLEIGAALLFLLLLGMTLGVRVRVLPMRAVAPLTELRPTQAATAPPLATSAPPRPRRLPVFRRAAAFALARDAVIANVPEAARDSPPTESIPEPPVKSLTLDIAAYTASHFQQMAPQRLPAVARPQSLLPLYGAFAALQVADAVTTIRALQHPGIVEANPLLRPFARNVPAMVIVKSASTAVTIVAVERLWRKNRVAAVATMVGINAAYGVVVSRNAGAVR